MTNVIKEKSCTREREKERETRNVEDQSGLGNVISIRNKLEYGGLTMSVSLTLTYKSTKRYTYVVIFERKSVIIKVRSIMEKERGDP